MSKQDSLLIKWFIGVATALTITIIVGSGGLYTRFVKSEVEIGVIQKDIEEIKEDVKKLLSEK